MYTYHIVPPRNKNGERVRFAALQSKYTCYSVSLQYNYMITTRIIQFQKQKKSPDVKRNHIFLRKTTLIKHLVSKLSVKNKNKNIPHGVYEYNAHCHRFAIFFNIVYCRQYNIGRLDVHNTCI